MALLCLLQLLKQILEEKVEGGQMLGSAAISGSEIGDLSRVLLVKMNSTPIPSAG